MGAGRRTQTFNYDTASSSYGGSPGGPSFRGLVRLDLAGVIFGCTNKTMRECLQNNIFGLPAPHFAYVQHIIPGMPLFLLNYSNRKIHGVFEAVSDGTFNINPYGWTDNGSEKTQFPAQVRVCINQECEPLAEPIFKKVINQNYYLKNKFWFELDRAQTDALLSLFRSRLLKRSSDCSTSNVARAIDFSFCHTVQDASVHEYNNSSNDAVSTRGNETFSNTKIPKGGSDFSNEPYEEETNKTMTTDDEWPALPSQAKASSFENKASLPTKFSDNNQIDSNCKASNSFDRKHTEAMASQTSDNWESSFDENIQISNTVPENTLEGNHIETSNTIPDCETENPLEGYPTETSNTVSNIATSKEGISIQNSYEVTDFVTVNHLEENPVQTSNTASDDRTMNTLEGNSIEISNTFSGYATMNSSEEKYLKSHDLNLSTRLQGLSIVKDKSHGLEEIPCLGADSREVHPILRDRDASLLQEIAEMRKEQLAFQNKMIEELRDRNERLEQRQVAMEADIKTLVDQVKGLHDLIENRGGLENDNGTWSSPYICLLGGYDETSWLKSVEAYYPDRDYLTVISEMPTARSFAAATVLDTGVYVFGGGVEAECYDTAERYDLSTGEWSMCSSMHLRKVCVAGVTFDNKIFALGGGFEEVRHSEVEMYDPMLGKWLMYGTMLHKRFALAATVMEGSIYALGGFDGKQYLRSVETYDPRESRWSLIEPMKIKRASLSVAVLNEKIYAIGGYNGSTFLSSVEVFDPRAGSWLEVEPIAGPRGYATAAVLDNTIYVIGGIGSNDTSGLVEYYSEGNGWESYESVIGKRSLLSSVVVESWGG